MVVRPINYLNNQMAFDSDIQIKYEKHLEEAMPILASELTPFEAFRKGCERAIASFIKLGTEGRVTQKLIQGPQNKNEATKKGEEIFSHLLEHFNEVYFFSRNNQYFVQCNGEEYNFSQVIYDINFNHVVLNSEQLHKYHHLILSGILKNKPRLPDVEGYPSSEDFIAKDPEGIVTPLEYSEKVALNIYTGPFFQSMNSLMRGHIDRAVEKNQLEGYSHGEKINLTLKEAFLHCVVSVSALNKLPDFIAPSEENGAPQKYVYRGENSISDQVLEKRIKAFGEGGGTTIECGFLSTAFSYPAADCFKEHAKAGILFKNVKGKKISPLSQVGDMEREILLPPTQVRWNYYKPIEIENDTGSRVIHFFIAKPVTIP